jgi:VCBS repeat-containing protein
LAAPWEVTTLAHSADDVGLFSFDPVTEGAGSGVVGGHFTADNSAFQFLAQDEALTQTSTATVGDTNGGTAAQDISTTILGTNDTAIQFPDAIAFVDGPTLGGWIRSQVAGANSSEAPDAGDANGFVNIDALSGRTAIQFPDAVALVDGPTLGGWIRSQVTGTTGSEALVGGSGNDVLVDNPSIHVLAGGSGDDTFTFLQTTDGTNTITDFNNMTEHDVVAVSASGFGGGLTAGMDVTSLFETSNGNLFQSSDSRFHFDAAQQTLYFSADGTAASEVALVQFQGGVTLHPNDLLVV